MRLLGTETFFFRVLFFVISFPGIFSFLFNKHCVIDITQDSTLSLVRCPKNGPHRHKLPFLACCVPDLHGYSLAVYYDFLCEEIRANGGFISVFFYIHRWVWWVAEN